MIISIVIKSHATADYLMNSQNLHHKPIIIGIKLVNYYFLSSTITKPFYLTFPWTIAAVLTI